MARLLFSRLVRALALRILCLLFLPYCLPCDLLHVSAKVSAAASAMLLRGRSGVLTRNYNRLEGIVLTAREFQRELWRRPRSSRWKVLVPTPVSTRVPTMYIIQALNHPSTRHARQQQQQWKSRGKTKRKLRFNRNMYTCMG